MDDRPGVRQTQSILSLALQVRGDRKERRDLTAPSVVSGRVERCPIAIFLHMSLTLGCSPAMEYWKDPDTVFPQM